MEGFTKRYGCKKLVYYEQCGDMYSAIEREKQVKAGSRKKKIALIERMNPQWLDLYETLF
jgi:predicted GIY-YIG superfamily endonuclease